MKYFTDDELQCPGSGIIWLADGFAEKLVELREAWGKPMHVNSCCRSLKHNTAIGGHPNSAHVYDHPDRSFTGTYAIDIRCIDSANRADLVQLALSKGWCIGINKTFLHLDRRLDYLPGYQQVIFLY